MRKLLRLVFIAGSLLALGGCAQVTKFVHEFTPEVSVGVFKDNGSGVTVGVKLGGSTTAATAPSPVDKTEENKDQTPKEETK